MATWFTSDTHFGDHRVLNLYPRPWSNAAEMDEALVQRWNAVVAPGDEVWHLGDFARTAALAAALLPRLNGTKHLVTGNNDPSPEAALGAPGGWAPGGWASGQLYAEIERDGLFLVLCHYPFRSWNRQHRGALNLHGHSHGRLKPLPRQHDVGVDVRDYAPVSLAALTRKAGPAARPAQDPAA